MNKDADHFIRIVYEQAAVPLFIFAFRFTRDRTMSEDVVQEVLVRAWRRAGHLEPGSDALRAWLYATARNYLIDIWRARSKEPATVPHEQVPNAAYVADDVDRALQRRALADALDKLTPKHRDVLIERYFKSRSVAETAQELGVSPGTVKSRTHHAFRALQELISEVEIATG
ncbi:sigma-70 family RNA polymerase sigma factor [Pseudonocardia yunnanensis]|uniref:Sigma-70 family RNA polymerase sigma factor n=1 Tax=Pseudonocardia yunnanensis TaxID=58107 RepID=A0ABW4EUA2_9PSEU